MFLMLLDDGIGEDNNPVSFLIYVLDIGYLVSGRIENGQVLDRRKHTRWGKKG